MSIPADWQTADGSIRLYRGDCLEIMPQLTDTVDAVICDLPYNTTALSWDSLIPFAPLWASYKRLVKASGAVVLFGSQPFTSALVMSNPKGFRYEWIWQKTNGGGFLNASRMPLKRHENILVFSQSPAVYNPQKTQGKPWSRGPRVRGMSIHNGGKLNPDFAGQSSDGSRFPTSVQPFNNSSFGGIHPTQKPTDLLEYLIKTYTNAGETVLDNTFGSGTTAIACINTGRKFIGIERDPAYFDLAVTRLETALGNVGLFADTAPQHALTETA